MKLTRNLLKVKRLEISRKNTSRVEHFDFRPFILNVGALC